MNVQDIFDELDKYFPKIIVLSKKSHNSSWITHLIILQKILITKEKGKVFSNFVDSNNEKS